MSRVRRDAGAGAEESETMHGVSVVVCCFNSESVLPETLAHLSRQEMRQPFAWEVIVVDNRSTDATAAAAQAIWKECGAPVPLRIVVEHRQGLNFARESGVRAASFPIIVFCDDDNWLAKDYLEIASVMMTADREIGCLGGHGEATSDSDMPPWFARFQRSYAVGPQGNGEGIAQYPLYGAGLCARRELLDEAYTLGFRSLLSGRKGRTLSAGDDSEMAAWVSLLGFPRWVYTPRLRFRHYIAPHRLKFAYLLRMKRGFGQSAPILSLYALARKNQLETYRGSWVYQLVRASVVMLRSLISCRDTMALRSVLSSDIQPILWLLKDHSRFREAKRCIASMRDAAEESMRRKNALPAEEVQQRT